MQQDAGFSFEAAAAAGNFQEFVPGASNFGGQALAMDHLESQRHQDQQMQQMQQMQYQQQQQQQGMQNQGQYGNQNQYNQQQWQQWQMQQQQLQWQQQQQQMQMQQQHQMQQQQQMQQMQQQQGQQQQGQQQQGQQQQGQGQILQQQTSVPEASPVHSVTLTPGGVKVVNGQEIREENLHNGEFVQVGDKFYKVAKEGEQGELALGNFAGGDGAGAQQQAQQGAAGAEQSFASSS